jgi:hypothetical protein
LLLCLGVLSAALAALVVADQLQPQTPGPRPAATPGAVAATGSKPLDLIDLPLGTVAPDFNLPDARGKGMVRLSSYRGRRPVVLFFGSFSCDIFDFHAHSLEPLYEKYGKRAAFLFVNVREAGHPDDEFKFLYADFKDKESLAQRRGRICRALDWLKLTMPTVIDETGKVDAAYHAFPTRLVVVGRDGRIVFNGGISNPNYRNPNAIDEWLDGYLDNQPPPPPNGPRSLRQPPAVGLAVTSPRLLVGGAARRRSGPLRSAGRPRGRHEASRLV